MNSRPSPDRFRVKLFGFRSPQIGCAVIVLALTTATHASLVPTVFVDTPTQLFIVWDWDEFNAAGAQIADLSIPGLVNWDVALTTNPFGPPPVIWDVVIQVSHITNPHPGDVGGGGLATLTKAFDDDQFLGLPVLPDVFANVAHPAIGHFDAYEMQIFHSALGNRNVIKLFGTHDVPSPSTLSLLALGAFAGRRRRR